MVSTPVDAVTDAANDGTDARLTVVSSDAHAGPADVETYRPYVEARHIDAFDDYARQVHEYNLRHGLHTGGRGEGHEGLWDISVRVRDLDADGIAAEVIYPQGSIPFANYPTASVAQPPMDYTPSAEHRNAGAHIYNRWLADFCSVDHARHGGVATLPIRDIALSIVEARWAREHGLVGVSLPPLVPDTDILPYNDVAYEPLWAECEALELPLHMHSATGGYYGSGPDAIALSLSECDWFSHRALPYLIWSGVFERHPNLHVVVTEQRLYWVPQMLDLLDSIYLTNWSAGLREVLPQKPSEYFARNCFLGASHMSRQEFGFRDAIGVDRIMWGSDYPHVEGTWPWNGESLRYTFEGATDAELRAMLGGNAAECYQLDWPHLQEIAAKIGPTIAQLRVPLEELPDDPFSWAWRTEGPYH